jgi:hypothetical protein
MNRLQARPVPTFVSIKTIQWNGLLGQLKRSSGQSAKDKPILLSVGYSACHWCHVMAHESFEHQPTGGDDESLLHQRQSRS